MVNLLRTTIILVFYCLISGQLKAQETKTLKIGSPLDSPPFVYEGEGKGIELEIIATILAEMGYEAKWVHLPPKRLMQHLDDGHIDAAARAHESNAPGIFFTQNYITFHNVAATFNDKIESLTIADLAKHEIVAFQNAKENLGNEYMEAVERSPSYREIPDQVRQVHLLAKKRFCVAIMEMRIFEYFMSTHYPKLEARVFPIFEPRSYSMAFVDQNLRNRFDQILQQKEIRSKLSAIWERYGARQHLNE